MSTGLESVLDAATDIAPPENTIPTPEELAAQAGTSDPLIAGHRKGRCYCEARVVQDGYAYRLAGSSEDSPWQWMRHGDFARHFVVWRPIEGGMLLDILEQSRSLHRRLEIALRSMGKASWDRYNTEMERIVDGDRQTQQTKRGKGNSTPVGRRP